MIKNLIIPLSLMFTVSTASAELRPYVNGDIGYADNDFDSGVSFTVGGGLQFKEHIEIELAYNDYGEDGVTDVTAYSAGINLGGKVSDTLRLYGILGAERLEVEGGFSVSTSFGSQRISFDDSSTEGFYGAGAAFELEENLAIRFRVLSHNSGDIVTANIGLAYYF